MSNRKSSRKNENNFFSFLFFLFSHIEQKIEKPFLAAVQSTLGDRYTDNVEGIYKITIKFIIETLIEGFESGQKQPNNVGHSKSVNSSSNNTNGANTTLNGDTSCKSSTKPSTDAS